MQIIESTICMDAYTSKKNARATYKQSASGRFALLPIVLVAGCLMQGCTLIEDTLFPVWEPYYFEEPPAELGPYTVRERRVEVADGADGEPFGITVFEPGEATGPLPAFLWIMGSNVQAYYHQSLHENLASWGYLVLVPDTRPLRFTDTEYHKRLLELAEQTMKLARSGELGLAVDDTRLAAGGYSVGGPLAVFLAARNSAYDAIVHWAPSGAPIWQGVDPDVLYLRVTQPSLYVLGSRDRDAPPDGGYPDLLQDATPRAMSEEFVIEGAVHHQFQQPVGADQFGNEPGITREEQQRLAITATREWLDVQFGITRMAS